MNVTESGSISKRGSMVLGALQSKTFQKSEITMEVTDLSDMTFFWTKHTKIVLYYCTSTAILG